MHVDVDVCSIYMCVCVYFCFFLGINIASSRLNCPELTRIVTPLRPVQSRSKRPGQTRATELANGCISPRGPGTRTSNLTNIILRGTCWHPPNTIQKGRTTHGQTKPVAQPQATTCVYVYIYFSCRRNRRSPGCQRSLRLLPSRALARSLSTRKRKRRRQRQRQGPQPTLWRLRRRRPSHSA